MKKISFGCGCVTALVWAAPALVQWAEPAGFSSARTADVGTAAPPLMRIAALTDAWSAPPAPANCSTKRDSIAHWLRSGWPDLSASRKPRCEPVQNPSA